MELITIIFGILLGSFLLGEAFNKFNMPKVLGPLLLGALLTNEPFNSILHSKSTFEVLDFAKELGLIFLLFFIGLKIDLRDFKRSSKRSVLVAFFAALVPFLLGFFGVLFLQNSGVFSAFIADNIYLAALVVGTCLSITAEGVIIETLEELGIVRTIVGETVIESGIIDDIIGIILISIIVALIPGKGGAEHVGIAVLYKMLEILIFTGIIFIIGYFIVPRLMKAVEKEKSTITFFTVSILIALALAAVTNKFGLGGAILGALFGGIIIRHTLLTGDLYERREETYITNIIEVTTFGFLAYFFFLWIGLNVNISVINEFPLLTILFIILATIGKLLGALFGNKLAKGRSSEGLIIGWGMNTRSEVDIMVATLALSTGIITVNLFSLLIFMSFATTVISPTIFRFRAKKHHSIR